MVRWRLVLGIVLAGWLLPAALSARVVERYIGSDISQHIPYVGRDLFQDSDTLRLNGRILERGSEYTIDRFKRRFELSVDTVSAGDTLTVIYTALPRWLKASIGRELPEESGGTAAPRPFAPDESWSRTSAASSNVRFSGAKSFRFSARSSGSSEFSQALDLAVSGEISPGVEITGAISDRGYDPTYGTANSRLSELDKVNLSLRSKRLAAQIGDITLQDLPDLPATKSVSGATAELTYPTWSAGALVSRPRGRFTTARFQGQDGFQGPYQISRGSGAESIVPGSETVWLDGARLEKGAGKDFTIDYATGRVTFTAAHPIDRRSRIEIDYEPLAGAYEEELIALHGGGGRADSTWYLAVGMLRDGDDREQPITGELSPEDLALLQQSGDTAVARSGARADTLGSYVLITDSLPDSLYRYVGAGNGNWDVRFSFVGTGGGSYRFLGGDRYEYVGEGNGDYRPVVVLETPERTDYVRVNGGWRNETAGDIELEFRGTRHDRNLFSRFDDDDNDGALVLAQWKKAWGAGDRQNRLRLLHRRLGSRYRSRTRINRPDFARDYLLPAGGFLGADENLTEFSGSVSPDAHIVVKPAAGLVHYRGTFDSKTGGIDVDYHQDDGIDVSAGYSRIETSFVQSDSMSPAPAGTGDNVRGSARMGVNPGTALRIGAEWDRRHNTYNSFLAGTKYMRLGGLVESATERASYEYYVEDSLTGDWSEILSRHRLTAGSQRRLGHLTYDLTASYQWLDRPDGREENFLSRTSLQYQQPRNRLSISAAYTISEERRNARGITYLEVEPGQGEYILEDGRYVPDPDGNFIQVEELLSESERVRRGERAFNLNKDWRTVLVRFNSVINEELLPGGSRPIWWLVPFLSDGGEPFLYYSRRYDGDLRLLPSSGFHAVNFAASEDVEQRLLAGQSRRRRDVKGSLTLKQRLAETYLSEVVELFRSTRDIYYADGGDIDGYRAGTQARQRVGRGELSGGFSIRRAESKTKERSLQYTATAGSRFPIAGAGELRTSLDVYWQDLSGVAGVPPYRLTDSRFGKRGVVWSVMYRQGVRGGLRINAAISGRHADDRIARITGRGEIVAGF